MIFIKLEIDMENFYKVATLMLLITIALATFFAFNIITTKLDDMIFKIDNARDNMDYHEKNMIYYNNYSLKHIDSLYKVNNHIRQY